MTESSASEDESEIKQSTREVFLVAGAKVLADVGPEKMSLRAVAKQANLSPMAPYRHFTSKEGLLAELSRKGFLQLGHEVRDACPNGVEEVDTTEFRAMAAAYISFAENNRELYRLMFSAIIPDFTPYPELKRDAEWSYQVLQDAILVLQQKKIFRDENPRILAHHCWSVMHGFVNLSLDGVMNALSEECLSQRFMPHADLLISGMKNA